MENRLGYRVWDTLNNKWYEPTYEAYKGNLEYLVLNPSGSLGMMKNGQMIDESVFPSKFKVVRDTGLKDKNGKRIFEGDIVGYENHKRADIICEKCGKREFSLSEELEINGADEVIFCAGSFLLKGSEDAMFWFQRKDIVVIGNIYENPELLEPNVT